ncbi:MAG: sigma 54-interacting transcriptional regulator [Desulfobacterales bacterium]|nr:sigma 54-interacting transcriptional regulator [Desulfobacterales bacterium]MDD4394190.1 sigma 54-interacting transcriptional regulator [Desulfobacterales bacterium]
MQAEEKLEMRIAYEKMLAEISDQAVSFDNLQVFLKSSLHRMGNILDVSRVFIFTYNSFSETFSCICEWVGKGIASLQELGELTISIPWGAEKLKKGQIINCSNVHESPILRFKERMQAGEIKSTLNFPLFIKGEFYGFMGFDECRYYRNWIDEDVYILTTAGQIITKAIENKMYEEELEKHRSRLESVFSSVQDAVVTVDTQMNVISANKAVEHICGIKAVIGRPFIDCASQCNQSCVEVLKKTLNAGKTIRNYHIECGHHDRNKLIAMVNSSPLLNSVGKFLGAVLVIRDITRLTHLEEELKERHHFHNIVGKNEKMQKIYHLLEMLADQSTTVMITGESGTGKELVAKALHYAGTRANGPYITVNCSALSENLLESELFGHAKGAFTGADRDKIGRFEAAAGGTILLDEIGDISPHIQVKLLRVLQEKEVERVGETSPRKVDARVITATNRNLAALIEKGLFREDLYYRLNVFEIELPPLRKRYDDIPLLVSHFCDVFNKSYKKQISGVSDEVQKAFMNYPWPGNVRELAHVIERAFVLCRNQIIEMDHLPSDIRNFIHANKQLSEKRTESGPDQILRALEKTDWNISKAARLLAISRWTMYRRCQTYNISRPMAGKS